ncbi:hypothetical protein F5883DRAFT_563809 [Diaporthe sp. PMI_573]|nr:hypothetical protein F5883DRAFT_563809 [Diaporthaceae sp. PMI_573]
MARVILPLRSRRASIESSASQQPRTGLDMRDIGDAIDGVIQGQDTRRASATLLVSPPGHSRRRSSPRPEPVVHRVEDEELPDDEFHHPAFQRRLSQARSMLEDLTRVLSSSSIHLEPDSIVKRHHQESESLSKFQPLSTRTVGLVGESGVGKSSLINSLLDQDSLARTTGKGAACTCVVTEYHFHPADDFIIDVEMFSEDELCEQLAELLGSYRAFKSGGGGESKEKAEIAIDTFRSMFRGKLQDEEWILTEAEGTVLDQFQTWAKQARSLGSPGRQVAETLEECSSLLVPLSSEPNDPSQASVWPYVRKIKVSLKAHILSKGLVLVDLPGLRDLNSARRNITQQYVVKCHEIIAICGIKRAITDVGVRTVFELARQARLERVGIICTYADEINFNEIHNDWDNEEARPIKDFQRSLKTVERDIEEIKEELATFDNLPRMDAVTRKEKLEFLEEKMTLETRRDGIEFDLLRHAMTTRNSHVIQDLRREYTAQIRGETLQVFCVGNKMYQEKRYLDKSVAGRSLILSGIIEVRRHLAAVVGESQLRASKNFLEHQVPALLRDVELWVQSGEGSASAEEKLAIRNVLCKVENKLKKGLTSRRAPVNTIKSSLNNSFETNIWERRQIPQWTEASQDACKDWNEWHHSSYAAWLRARGEHQTDKRGKRNWNMEVIENMVADMKSPWDNLISDIRAEKVNMKQGVVACWEEAIVILESEWPGSNDEGDDIGQALDVRKDLLIDTVEDKFDRFNDLVSLLRLDTLTWLPGSMVRRIMDRVCREALQYSGRGCTKLQRAVVNRTFANEDVFHSITRELRRCFQDHAEGIQQELAELISTHLGAVRATLDIVREENAAEENERDPEFRQRVADEVTRARSLMEI